LKIQTSEKEKVAANPQALLRNSRLLIPAEQMEHAIDRWSVAVAARLAQLPPSLPVVALVVMRGGMQPAVWLLQRLQHALVIDTVQVTRYHNRTHGEQLHWRLRPAVAMRDQAVLLIDDIFDEGHTMAAIKQWCIEEGAAQVITCAMVRKLHARGLARDWLDLHALDVPDDYVFGCGMDIHGQWRHLPGIYVYQEAAKHE
jgi:hypoxanthine phosphoribosyltransferase